MEQYVIIYTVYTHLLANIITNARSNRRWIHFIATFHLHAV
jgi:hypothetical protein